MQKKLALFTVFLVFLASIAEAAEALKTENLTPRQLLLLQVQEGYELTLDDINWSVLRQSDYGPIEVIKISNAAEIIFYFTEGEKPKGLINFDKNLLGQYVLTIKGVFNENGEYKVIYNAYPFKITPDIETDIGNAVTREVKKILSNFGILKDEDLAAHIQLHLKNERQLLLKQLPDNYALEAEGISWEVRHESPWDGPVESITLTNSGFITIISAIGAELKSLTAFADMGLVTVPIMAGAFDKDSVLIPDKIFENEFSKEDIVGISRGIAKKTREALSALGIESNADLKAHIESRQKKFSGKKAAI